MQYDTRDPKSPAYEPTREEQRRRRAEKQEREATAHRLKMLKKEADCRECGAENDNPKELCEDCDE